MKKTLIALALVIPLIANAAPQSCMFLHAYVSMHPEVDDIAGYKQKCADDTAVEARLASLPSPTIGMSAKAVREQTSWGEPDRVNKTITANAVREQWVYGHQYLYFTNGKLTAAQMN